MKQYKLFSILILFSACTSNDDLKNESVDNKVANNSNKIQFLPKNDRSIDNESKDTINELQTTPADNTVEQAGKTIIDFLKWYRKNMNRLGDFELVNNFKLRTYDSTKFYSVNFEETEKYLSEIKKGGYVSEMYLKNQRTYFKKCDENFKKNPQNDGAPAGFDFDLITLGNGYDIILLGDNYGKEFDEVFKANMTVTKKAKIKQRLRYY